LKANECTKAAVGSSNDVFFSDNVREPFKPLGHKRRVFDGVGDRVNNARYNGLVVWQLYLFPDLELMLMPWICGYEGG
jgi:hypothetical protein